MEEAVTICKEEWQHGLDEMGHDPEFDFYVELEESNESELIILDMVKLNFKKRLRRRTTT